MELPDVGKHCAYVGCSQLDFLPIDCRYCHKSLCAEHGAPLAHECQKYNPDDHDVRVPECPKCGKPVPVRKGDDPNIWIQKHIASGCVNAGTTTSLQAVAEAKRGKGGRSPTPPSNVCAAPSCKARVIVPMTCSACHLNFCVKHRMAQDHACSPSRLSKASNAFGKMGHGGGSGSGGSFPTSLPGLAALKRLTRWGK